MRRGAAVFYVVDLPFIHPPADAMKRPFRQIGLTVDLRYLPPASYNAQVATGRYDIILTLWAANYQEYEYQYINELVPLVAF